jgi:hypothetical protein
LLVQTYSEDCESRGGVKYVLYYYSGPKSWGDRSIRHTAIRIQVSTSSAIGDVILFDGMNLNHEFVKQG